MNAADRTSEQPRDYRPVLGAARLGLVRGWIELRQSLSNRSDQVWIVLVNGILIGVLFFQRDSELGATGFSLALATLPGLIAMNVAMGGWMGVTQQLAAEREDGTLLRSKATPNGMTGYLVARVTVSVLNTLLGIVVFIVAGVFLVPGLADVPASGWLMLVVVFLLGMLATMPWGAVLGAVVKSSGSGFALSFLPLGVLIAISGIFYPITAMAGWLHPVAMVFPVYWLGAGMREALLPAAAGAAELGGEFHTLAMFGVLSLWAVVGLALAPGVLRRMARRESGSALESRKQAVLQAWS